MVLNGEKSGAAEREMLDRVKQIVRRDLKLGEQAEIPDDMPFFGGDFDLDSLDVLLLLTSIEKTFGLKIPSEAVGQSAFKNISTLTQYIAAHRPADNGHGPATAANGDADPLAGLPHQPPFRFVTRVIELQAGQSGKATWVVTGEEAFLSGHFPGRPIVPGVLIGEALAQWSGVVGNPKTGLAGKLAQINIRFDQSVIPPAEIELESKVIRAMDALHHFEVSAKVKTQVVARGELTIRYDRG